MFTYLSPRNWSLDGFSYGVPVKICGTCKQNGRVGESKSEERKNLECHPKRLETYDTGLHRSYVAIRADYASVVLPLALKDGYKCAPPPCAKLCSRHPPKSPLWGSFVSDVSQ